MSFDPITNDEVRLSKEAILAAVANVNTSVQGTGIKSVQRGVVTPPDKNALFVAITAVNPAKTTVSLLSRNGSNGGSYVGITSHQVRLKSATELEVFSYSTTNFDFVHPLSWEAVEWK